MPIRASLTLRWARALALGSVAFCAGLVAHVAADGLVPGPTGLVLLLALSAACAAVFLGREASALRLVALLVGGQTLVHTGLAALAGHRGDPVTPASTTPVTTSFHPAVLSGPRTGSTYDQWAQSNPALHAGAGGTAVPAWMVHSVADVAQQPLMALTHVLAAVAVGLWLALGERALWAVLALTAAWAVGLVTRLVGLFLGAARPVAPRLLALRPTAYPASRRPRANVRARPVRRGPPHLLTAH